MLFIHDCDSIANVRGIASPSDSEDGAREQVLGFLLKIYERGLATSCGDDDELLQEVWHRSKR